MARGPCSREAVLLRPPSVLSDLLSAFIVQSRLRPQIFFLVTLRSSLISFPEHRYPTASLVATPARAWCYTKDEELMEDLQTSVKLDGRKESLDGFSRKGVLAAFDPLFAKGEGNEDCERKACRRKLSFSCRFPFQRPLRAPLSSARSYNGFPSSFWCRSSLTSSRTQAIIRAFPCAGVLLCKGRRPHGSARGDHGRR